MPLLCSSTDIIEPEKEKKKEMKNLVEFDDLPLAAYLHLQDFRIVKIRTKKNKQGWGVFAFPHENGIDRSVAGFYANQALVEPRAYILKIRNLKDLVREVAER